MKSEIIRKPVGLMTPEEREQENLRVRARYAERLHLKKVGMYFKALSIVRTREMITHRLLRLAVMKETQFGQDVCVVGDAQSLGAWNLENSAPMKWTPGNVWVAEIEVPADREAVLYKYVVRSGDHYEWEWGQNHCVHFKAIFVMEDRVDEVQDVWGQGNSVS